MTQLTMTILQIMISENLTYGIITTLVTIVFGMALFVYNGHTQHTKAQFDTHQNEDKAHMKEVSSLRERMIKAETRLEMIQKDTNDMKRLLKENYEKLDDKLERILETINKR